MSKNKFNWLSLIAAVVGFGFCFWKVFHLNGVLETALLIIVARASWQCACNIEQTPREVAADKARRKLGIRAARRRLGPLWAILEAIGPLCVVLAGVLAATMGTPLKFLILALYVGGLALMCILAYLVKDEINTIQKEEEFRAAAASRPQFFTPRPKEDASSTQDTP